MLVDGLAKAGWPVPKPAATMFCWAPMPEPFAALGSLGFAKLLLEEADVAVSPGIGFGEYGEGYVRLALVENRQRLRQAVRNIRPSCAPAAATAPSRAGRGLSRWRSRCGSASPASAPSAPAPAGCCADRAAPARRPHRPRPLT